MNSTLENGLHLLKLLADAPQPHSVSELSRETGLPKSHIHRLLQTLVKNQYVEQNTERRYYIGIGALRLGHALLRDIPLRRRFLPAMVEGVKNMGIPITLALPFGSQAISVAYVHHDGEIRSTSETLGTVLPARSSALGKLFLAYQSPQTISKILPTLDYTPKGPHSHLTPESLEADLINIRSQAYSLNNQESGVQSASIAIPVFEDGNLIAGIGMSGSADDLIGEHLPRHLDFLQYLISETQPPPPNTPHE
ncbi:IclR family transcriptional regulator [Kiritimatiellota bacterium B12222]|nr:IclR family transcriptional regulator [Kiritimatiellota bacterium B12222]